jgi:hypothetical protein
MTAGCSIIEAITWRLWRSHSIRVLRLVLCFTTSLRMATSSARDTFGRTTIALAVDDWTLDQLLTFDAGSEDLEDADGEPDSDNEFDGAPVSGRAKPGRNGFDPPCDRARRTHERRFTRLRKFVVGSMPIRLKGLAAPERDEPGGDTATDAMIELVSGRTLRCELNGERTHDRCVGACYPRRRRHRSRKGAPGCRAGLPALQQRPVSRDRGASCGGRRHDWADVPAAGVLP